MANSSLLVGAEHLRLQAEGVLEKLERSLEISIRERGVDVHQSSLVGPGAAGIKPSCVLKSS